MKVAVVGATGAVGREMMRTLEERAVPRRRAVAARVLAVRRAPPCRSAASRSRCASSSEALLRGVDVALVSAGASVSRSFIPEAAANGTVCIDNSSAFRMDPDVPLTIPEVNPESLGGLAAHHRGAELHHDHGGARGGAAASRRGSQRRLVLSSYQSVSGAGHTGVSELLDQVEKLRGDEASLAHPVHEALPTGPVFGKTIAYNVVAKIGEFEADGFTGEEVEDDGRTPQDPGSARPARGGHERPGAGARRPRRVRSWRSSRGRSRCAMRAKRSKPRPASSSGTTRRGTSTPRRMDSAGLDVALVGRIRQVPGRADALALFSCADNLRKGAALNAVQIAEHLFARTD